MDPLAMTGDSPDDDSIPIDPDLEADDPGEPSRGRPRDEADRIGRAKPGVLAAISVGSMFGAAARFGIAQALPTSTGGFPLATFTANVSGSFLLGCIVVTLIRRFPPSRHLRPFLATGFLGAYTTMSTFQVETVTLVKDGHPMTGATYGLVSIIAGLGAAWLGIIAARSAFPQGPSPLVRPGGTTEAAATPSGKPIGSATIDAERTIRILRRRSNR